MEWVELFLTFLISQKKKPSLLTVKNYKADVRHFILWFERGFQKTFHPAEITPTIIDLYKKSQDISARSMERHLSALRKFFVFLTSQNFVDSNPFDSRNQESGIRNQEDPWKLKDFKNYLYVYNKSPLTIKNYINDITQFLLWLSQVSGINDAWDIREKNIFDKIGQVPLGEYKDRLLKTGFSPVSINRKLSSLRKYITWAQAEGFIKLGDRKWAPFPPVRFLQKTGMGVGFIFDSFVTYPLARGIGVLNHAIWLTRGKPLFQSIRNKSLGPSIKNVSKEMYAPLSISTKYLPLRKKILHHIRYTRPEWYKSYHNITLTHYLHLGILMVLTSITGVFLYQHFSQAPKQEILGIKNEIFSKRTLFFQGRLADARQIPITKPVLAKFAIYEDPTTQTPIWEEVQNITPDQNGAFETTLGTKNPLSQQLFIENAGLYLGIAVGLGEELFPREPIATVSNAAESATLQGFPLISENTARNVVLALDSSGNLTIGANSSPIFQATDGDFTLSGQSLILTTIRGSNGDTVLAPDGGGKIDIQKPIHNTSEGNTTTGVPGAVEIADLLAIIATASSQSALTINQNSTGPIVSAQNGKTLKFVLESDGSAYISGNVGVGKQNPIAKLQVSGDVAPGETNTYNLGSPSLRWDRLYINSIDSIVSSSGTLGFWQRVEGAVSPSTITDAINLGATATSSATVHLAATSDENSFIKTGKFGIGTVSPGSLLSVNGSVAIGTYSTGAAPSNGLAVSGNVGIGTTSPNYKVEVIGSINVTGDIYKNGTAYNNPDYAFEKWATGGIVKFADRAGASDYTGILSLEDTEAYVLQNFQLPRVASAHGVFERGDILLEKVEEAYIHLFDLNRKIATRIGNFAQAATAEIAIGLLQAKEIVTESIDATTATLGKVTTNELISPIAQIDQIHTHIISPLAQESNLIVQLGKDSATEAAKLIVQNQSGAGVATIDSSGNAEFLGTLTSQALTTTDASISGILRARKIIADQIDGPEPLPITGIDIASYSAQLGYVNDFTSTFGKFTQGLVALGPTSLTDTTISGNLTIGKYLTLANTSINVIGANLELQPMRQGGISFLSGLVSIDTDGNLTVRGGLMIQNASGSAVLTINSIGDLIASGAATIKKLNFDGVFEAIAISDIEVLATSSAGIATISANRSTLTINNPLITDKSLIYITPRKDSENQVIYLLRQIPNTSFTVGIQKPAAKDIPFNWLIVN